MYHALLATEAPLTGDELRHDLVDAGIAVLSENVDPASLAQDVVRNTPDLVLAASISPSAQMFEAARMLGTLAPCPFILFTSDSDAAKIERASTSGIHAYVVDGYARHRLLSIVQVARARFRHGQVLREELIGLSQRFEERKLVDRAKGALMRSRGITEEEAFEVLRSLAMRARQRIGVVSQSVIDMSRAGEAVNRAGQLRMLSQRLVRCYAQILCGREVDDARQIMADCMMRTEANLGILKKAISAKGYGDLVDRVAASWQEVALLCKVVPDASRLNLIDARAETMLANAESLTEFLESSGLVESLHIINVAGRQRMLGQRVAKLCFLLALEPGAARLAQLRGLADLFQTALDHLHRVPLSSPPIRASLDAMSREWLRLQTALQAIGDNGALDEISGTSERLLDVSERLTDLYEQAMQVLIGDRIGRMRP